MSDLRASNNIEKITKKNPEKTKTLLLEGSVKEWQKLIEDNGNIEKASDIAIEISNVWELLEEKQEYSVSKKLVEATSGFQGGEFPYMLCAQMMERNISIGACRILSEACLLALKETRKGIGSSKKLEPIKNFINDNIENLSRLPLEVLKGERGKKTIDALLQGTFVTTSKKAASRLAPEIQFKTLDALILKFKTLDIFESDHGLPDKISAELGSWPLMMLSRARSVYKGLPSQTIASLQHSLETHPTVQDEADIAVETETKEQKPLRFSDALNLVEEIFNSAEDKVAEANDAIKSLKDQLQKEKENHVVMEAKSRKIVALQDKNDRYIEKNDLLEEKLKECKAELNKIYRENKYLRKNLDDEKKSHKRTADMIGKKVESGSGSQLRVFKERLAAELNNDYQDALRISGAEMTVARGEMLCHSFEKLFNKLKKLGIELRGE